ncbi:MAG: ATP-binding protein [Actinomycetota bacterium]|nr:ATP-binding protein [Actinomycetota bacterium]
MAEAIDAVGSGLGTDCGVVFEVRGLNDLVAVAPAECNGGVAPARAGFGLHAHAHARFTLVAEDPVIIEDLSRETRFSTLEMIGHGLTSGLSASITVDGAPYGVLAAYATRRCLFSDEDASFVQAVANVVGMGTERHRQAEARRTAQQHDRLAAVGRLAAGAAHDFNNIVAAISLYAELLEQQHRLDDAGRDYVGAIRQQVERGASLVWQVLDFAHRSSLKLVDVDMACFLDQLVPLLRRTLPKGLVLSLQHDGEPYLVRADTTRLQQIFMNLVSNAKDAIEAPGQVTLSLFRHGIDADGSSPLDNPMCRPSVRVDVADTGSGMDAGVLTRAFEPFFSTKSPGQGSGLGLAQVHGLVSQHEGHIDLLSVVGRGTTVSIWLTGREIMSTDQPETPAEIPRGQGEQVLVVDDDPAVRVAMARVLSWLGYAATEADSAEAAISVLSSGVNSIAVVVSDVMMPGMGGESLARVVANRWPPLPVILVSGYPISVPTDRAADPAGRGEMRPPIRLQKPFSSRQMAAAIETALSSS